MKTLHYANGDEVPIIGLGTWKSESGEVYRAVREAIGIGYRHIDCAAIYMNEKEIGSAFSDAINAGDVTREEHADRFQLLHALDAAPSGRHALCV